MSVINQMLRDLESRKVKSDNSRHYIDEVSIIAPEKMNPWWLILPVLIVVILSASLYLRLKNQENTDIIMVHEKQAISDPSEMSVLHDLPTQLSDVKHNLINSDEKISSDNSTIKREENAVIPEKQSKPKTGKHLSGKVERLNTQTSNNQPSVKIKTIIKPPVQASVAEKKVVRIPPEIIKTVAKPSFKEPVKFKQDKISKTELIHQARLLMTDDQLAAIKLLEDNMREVAPDSDYYALLANLYQRQERFDEAIIFYQKALKLVPNKGELWIGIALAYESTGESANSQMAFKKAISSKNINPGLKRYAAQRVINE